MRWLLATLLLTYITSAQLQAQNKYSFRSKNYAGVLEGEEGTSFQLQTVNGFQYRTWFAGVGTGLDYYYFRSVPLFLSLTKDLCSCEKSFFFTVDGGLNWLWDNSTANKANGFTTNGEFSSSLYWAAGVGYKIGLKNRPDALLINLGYSMKKLNETIKRPTWCLMPPCPVIDVENVSYRFNRLSLKLGWMF